MMTLHGASSHAAGRRVRRVAFPRRLLYAQVQRLRLRLWWQTLRRRRMHRMCGRWCGLRVCLLLLLVMLLLLLLVVLLLLLLLLWKRFGQLSMTR